MCNTKMFSLIILVIYYLTYVLEASVYRLITLYRKTIEKVRHTSCESADFVIEHSYTHKFCCKALSKSL